MNQRAALPWALMGILLFAKPALAQISRRLENCSLYPLVTNETANTPRPPRIVIDEVKFDDSSRLPDQLQGELSQVVKATRTRAWPGWIDELQEVTVLGAMHDKGYFQAMDTAEVEIRDAAPDFQRVSITLHVEPGLQYRLGGVSFRSADLDAPISFPLEELRKLIPLSEGNVFSSSKIREGLDTLRKLYGTHGYIDFTPTPLTEVDDTTQRISLIFELDQQKQFRIGKINVLSFDPKLQALLESKVKAGDTFNSQVIEDFFEENKSALPPGASPEDMRREHTDVRAGLVDLTFNFLTCSQFRTTLDPVGCRGSRSFGLHEKCP